MGTSFCSQSMCSSSGGWVAWQQLVLLIKTEARKAWSTSAFSSFFVIMFPLTSYKGWRFSLAVLLLLICTNIFLLSAASGISNILIILSSLLLQGPPSPHSTAMADQRTLHCPSKSGVPPPGLSLALSSFPFTQSLKFSQQASRTPELRSIFLLETGEIQPFKWK